MTTHFKKTISIAVALVMLLTMCLSAPLTVSAATVEVTVNNSGTIYTVDATVGSELPAPDTRVNGMAFLGWYSDPQCTTEYGAVAENETRTAYAKYPSTVITFEQKTEYTINAEYRDDSDSRSGATYTSGVVTDPADSNNKVFELHSPAIWSSLLLPQYEAAGATGYALTAGNKYTVSFKYKLPDSVTSELITIRLLDGNAGKGSGTTRKPHDATRQSVDPQSEAVSAGVWYTYTNTFTASNVGSTLSPMLSIVFDTDNDVSNNASVTDAYAVANYILIDDVVITDNTAVAELDIPVDNTYTSFETDKGNFTSSGEFRSTTSASITDEEAHSGSYSLKVAPSGQNTYRAYIYNGVAAPNAIKLESYSIYTLSFWYKVTALTDGDNVGTNFFFERNSSSNVWSGQVDLTDDKIDITNSTKNEWIKQEFTFKTDDCTSYPYLAIAVYGCAGDVVYIDDVSIVLNETVGLHDYYCNFSADFSFYKTLKSNGDWPYYSSNVAFNTDNGILYFPTTRTDTPSASGAWVQHFAPYDGESFYRFESNSSYRIVVRYRQTLETESNTGYFSIGTKTAIPGSEAVKSLVINNQVGSTEWKEYTFNFTTGNIGNYKYLTLTFGSKDSTSVGFEVDYVKVIKGPFLNNNGDISKNTTAVGSEIPALSYDLSKLEFIGWYSDVECTQPFGAVLENETRTAYARYNKLHLNFTDGGLYDSRNDAASIVADPLDATNKVIYQDLGDYWTTIEPTAYDAIGATYYKLLPNVDYTVTFDYRLTSALSSSITLRINSGTIPDYHSNYPKTVYNNTQITVAAANTDTEWHTYTATFNSGNLANGDHLFLCMNTTDYSGKGIYLDNVTIHNTANFTNVTINNRGVITTVKKVVGTELDALTSLDEQMFLGWYSDPECTAEFGTVQANESRTAYAKYDTVKVGFNADSTVDGLTKLGQNWVVSLNSNSTFNVPSYDAVSANGVTLEANKTYAMRFIYKVVEGSDAGELSVLGNKLSFDAYTADDANTWTPAAITFTTTEATALQLSLTSDGYSSLYIDDLLVYNIDYTPEATVTAGSSTITVTKPVAQNNMQTGSITIELKEGEQLKANGITITYDLYATAFSEEIESSVILSEGSYDLDKDQIDGNGNKFMYFVPANAKNIKISAQFISSDETNLDIIAASIRPKSDKYTSGLRFRGRVYNDADINKVGFLLAPEHVVTAAGYESLTLENADECHAIKADATDVIYDVTEQYIDRQVILTGIDRLASTPIQCVIFVEYTDGSVKYSAAKSQSFNNIKSAYNVVNRGITSYYNDEYDDTRDKLLQSQSDGTFSFLLLSDTHIDYIHTIKEGEYWYAGEAGETSPDRPLIERELQMVIEMANTTDVDCIILGGDLIHGTSSYVNSMADLEFYAAMAQKSKVPVYVNRGNHDANDYHGTPCELKHIIDQEDWTTTLLDPASKNTAVHDENDLNSTYYYVDFENKKTRLIVLDPYNYPVVSNDGVNCTWKAETWEGFAADTAQLEWFAKVAIDAEKQGWNYVLSAHAPIYGPETFGSNTYIQAIVKAFNDKTSVTVGGLTVDYSETDGQIPFSVSGHTHKSSYRFFSDDHICINVGSGKVSYYPNDTITDSSTHKWYHPVRYEGTYSEALFDGIVYTPDSNNVTRYNFGVNPDNIFDFNESGVTVTEQAHERTDVQ